MAMKVRIEKDSFGDIEVPADKLYGANTARSLRNFPIGDERDRMPVSCIARYNLYDVIAQTSRYRVYV